MQPLIDWIVLHAPHAHWFLLGAILLAGVNIPISVDVILIMAGFLAATVVPDHLWHLYGAVVIGCYLSAALSYWFGRLLGKKLSRFRWFNKIAPPERLQKIQKFYHKYGFWTLLIGRFIPLGVRNCLFMSSGMSRISFLKFALWDLVACFTWASLAFYCFYTLGSNYHVLIDNIKIINLIIFLAFSVTVIGVIWYKSRNSTTTEGRKRLMNLSNGLSLLRAPLALLFLIDNTTVRLLCIFLAMATDSIDGYLARRSKTVSRFGAMLDPAMDKFFVIVCLGILVSEGQMEIWQGLTMIARDFALCLFGLYLGLSGLWQSYEFKAIRWGKVTTALQFIVLTLVTIGFSVSGYIYAAFVVFAVLALFELFQLRKSASTT